MRSMSTVAIHIFKLWAQNGQIGKKVSKLLNYVYIYTNSDISSQKKPNPAWENIGVCDDFDCLFYRYCRNKNLSIVVLLHQNFIRQKYQV